MTVEERRAPAVGAEVRRWRTERGLTLANVAERANLNVGYLSQIENDKASPSLACLNANAIGGFVGAHSHSGDEHHVVLRGRFRLRQGEHVVEVGPGDYVRWDGTIPHDGEVTGIDQERGDAAMLIVRIQPRA